MWPRSDTFSCNAWPRMRNGLQITIVCTPSYTAANEANETGANALV